MPSFPPLSFPLYKSDSEIIQLLSCVYRVDIREMELKVDFAEFLQYSAAGDAGSRLCTSLYILLHHCQPHTRKSLTDEHILFFYPLI